MPQHELGRAQRRAQGHNRKKRDRIVFGDRDVNGLYLYVLAGKLIDPRLGRTAQLAPSHLLRSHDPSPPRPQARDDSKVIR
jgi:hypothetical protein